MQDSERFETIKRHYDDLVGLFLPKMKETTGLPEGEPYDGCMSLLRHKLMGTEPADPADDEKIPPATAWRFADMLAYLWLLTLVGLNPEERASSLDEHMLRPRTHAMFKQFFSGTATVEITWDEAKEILSAVRDDLPEGQTIPASAEALLALCPPDILAL